MVTVTCRAFASAPIRTIGVSEGDPGPAALGVAAVRPVDDLDRDRRGAFDRVAVSHVFCGAGAGLGWAPSLSKGRMSARLRGAGVEWGH
jgi:hypothetical protein